MWSSLFSACLSLVCPCPPNRTETNYKGLWGLKKRPLGPTCPSSRTFPCPESGPGQQPSLKTPHSLETNCSGCLPLVGATELCLPKPPDFKTASSPRRSLRSPHRPTVNLMKICMLACLHVLRYCTLYVPITIYTYIYVIFYFSCLSFTCLGQEHQSQIHSTFTHTWEYNQILIWIYCVFRKI